MKVRVEGKKLSFSNFDEIDSFLEEKGYKRIIGNCNEWTVGKLLQLGNKSQFYICGTITDEKGDTIKAVV